MKKLNGNILNLWLKMMGESAKRYQNSKELQKRYNIFLSCRNEEFSRKGGKDSTTDYTQFKKFALGFCKKEIVKTKLKRTMFKPYGKHVSQTVK